MAKTGFPFHLHITDVRLHPIVVRLVSPFETSFGRQQERAALLVEVHTRAGAVGWGEVTANWEPGYSYETVHTAHHILRDFLIPGLLKAQPLTPESSWEWLESVRGHPIAKHALLSALFTAYAAEKDLSMSALIARLGGFNPMREAVEVGVSIGIQPSIRATLEVIEKHLAEGYRRIKLKIKPGWDVVLLRGVRAVFPDITLMADANSAYTLDDLDLLRQMDDFNLLMIEQPLAHDDIYQHSLLQRQMRTAICLDESIHSVGDVQLAHHIGACRVINLKPQRVGGLIEALKIHNFCLEHGLDLWVGGMLETGIGRAVSMAVAAMPGVTLPSDLSETRRYYQPDLTTPDFVLRPKSSLIDVPTAPGLGVTVIEERLAAAMTAYQNATLGE